MKTTSRLLTLLLALALVFTLMPAAVRAEETVHESGVTTETVPFQVNPLYSELYTADDFDVPHVEVDPEAYVPMATTYLTPAKAAEQVRTNMKDRNESFVVHVVSESRTLRPICDEMIELALQHTGKATEGDYLLWQYGGWEASSYKTWNSSTKTYNYDITFTVSYYTTAEQEKEMNTAVTNLINSLGVKYKSDYEKVCAVYDWICANVTYDYDNLEDTTYMLKHTAYAALVDKTAVCQGYAALFYRLMLELGVDNRLIAGLSADADGNAVAHGWNIVQLGDYYYNVDSTWDAGVEEYNFFLTSTWNFYNHYRYLDYETWEFHEEYPMAAEDYDPDVAAEIDPYIYIDYCGETAAFTLERDGTVTIVGTGSTYDFYPSNSIEHDGAPWQYWGEHVTKLVVEEGITELGEAACYKLEALESIQLPSTLTTIGERVFDTCTALTTVVLPEGLTTLERGAFIGSGIQYITLPNTLTTISSEAFRRCEQLKELTIPESVTYMGTYAFGGCDSLTSVVIPANVTGLGDYCFDSCENLEKAELHCPTIFPSMFLNCDKLSEVILHDTVTTISRSALRGMDALKEIVIPASVTQIGYSAFGENDIMDTIYFQGDAPEFDSNAFYGNVLTAYYPTFNPTWTDDVKKNYSGNITWVGYIPDCSSHSYTAVVTDPTCTEQGYTTYTCSNCGDSYVDDYTDPVNHSYEDGICVWCGHEPFAASWKYATTSLGGTINLNIYVDMSNSLVNDPDTFVRFVCEGLTTDVPVADALVSTEYGETLYRFTLKLNAKQVADTVTVQVMNGDETVGTMLEYSIMKYCMNRIDRATDPAEVAAAKALLNYAAAAQMYFNYNTENLANAGLSEEDKVIPTADVADYATQVLGSEPGLKATNASLMLESEVKVRVYFAVSEGYSIDDYTFFVDGVEVTPKQNASGYYIESAGIPAKDLDEMHTFVVGGLTVEYGPMCYVKNKLSSTDPVVLNAVNALYAYCKAAEVLLG